MTIIMYDSRRLSGTTMNFARKLGKTLNLPVKCVKDITTIDEDYILCTYTAGVGEVPLATQKFLENNSKYIKGVVANGSSNFKQQGLFALAGERISNEFGCELLKKLDMGGSDIDVEYVAKRCAKLLSLNNINLKILKEQPKSTFKNGVFTLVTFSQN